MEKSITSEDNKKLLNKSENSFLPAINSHKNTVIKGGSDSDDDDDNELTF
jgi:hypothetical protein